MLKLEFYSATTCNFDKDNLKSYNVRCVRLQNTNFLVWTGVRSAIPSHLKIECPNEKELGPLEFFCGEKTFNSLTSKSKQFYRLLHVHKSQTFKGLYKTERGL